VGRVCFVEAYACELDEAVHSNMMHAMCRGAELTQAGWTGCKCLQWLLSYDVQWRMVVLFSQAQLDHSSAQTPDRHRQLSTAQVVDWRARAGHPCAKLQTKARPAMVFQHTSSAVTCYLHCIAMRQKNEKGMITSNDQGHSLPSPRLVSMAVPMVSSATAQAKRQQLARSSCARDHLQHAGSRSECAHLQMTANLRQQCM
jgi:hypothetical protein